ncbi:MAG: hypothetical protein WD011_05885 [Nitriliruptoraceae bacterium]
MPDRPRPTHVQRLAGAVTGGVVFGLATWLFDDFAPWWRGVVMGLVFAVAWFAAGMIIERSRRR